METSCHIEPVCRSAVRWNGGSRLLKRHAFRLPRHPASVGIARMRVHDHLKASGCGRDSVEQVVLVVSELATNAIRHGPAAAPAEFEVAVTVLPDGACVVEVFDHDETPPVLRDLTRTDESGRGLHLVAAFADSWGVWHRGRLGKTVWALVRPPSRNGAATPDDDRGAPGAPDAPGAPGA
jgi:anti-sigma regulatory factor (Ser/Thr protein kinase)